MPDSTKLLFPLERGLPLGFSIAGLATWNGLLVTLCQIPVDCSRATTIGRLMYASPSWWRFLNESDLNHLESFVQRARRGGFLPDDASSFRDMAASANSNLFGSIFRKPHHVLSYLCRERPAIQNTTYGLDRIHLQTQKKAARISYLG